MTSTVKKRRRLKSTTTKKPLAGKFLSKINVGTDSDAEIMFIYGPPGIGKTSLAAQAKDCVFLIDSKEDGIKTLKRHKRVHPNTAVLPPVTSWEDVLDTLDELLDLEHSYKTIVIDSVTGIEALIHVHCCDEDFQGDWSVKGFHSFQQGYFLSAKKYLPILIDKLDALKAKGISVILIGHSEIKNHADPERESYDRYQPAIHHRTWAAIHKRADLILFLNSHVDLRKEGQKIKAEGGEDRYIHTSMSAAYDAKNRHGLPASIDMGDSPKEAWTNLQKAITE